MLLQETLSDNRSGIVIAGFGRNQIFPELVDFSTDGYVGRRIKTIANPPNTVSTVHRSAIRAFAQSEIVTRFMEGIDPGYSEFLKGAFRTSLIASNLKTFERWAPKSKRTKAAQTKIAQAAVDYFNNLDKESISYRRLHFSQPIVQMASLLPKDELANLAESLVSLTSLHRRVSSEIETVGGAIDVAVISKSEGFVWIKRKHYFPSELNPHFGVNYMRGI